MASEEETRSVAEQLRASRRGSVFAGFGDRTGHWSVSISLGLFALAMLATAVSLASWQFGLAGVLLSGAAVSSWFGMRVGHRWALPCGITALLLCIVAVVLVVTTAPL